MKNRLIILLLLCLAFASMLYFWKGEEANRSYTKTSEHDAYLSYLHQALDPLHQTMPKASSGEWLAEHEEKGQTFASYLSIAPVRATKKRTSIYVQPMGTFDKSQQDVFDLTIEFMEIYFGLPIKVLDSISLEVIPDSMQREHYGYFQVNSLYMLAHVLKPNLPDDAVAYIALTNYDLYPKPEWNFVFGQASLKHRVGVYSLARYGDPSESKEHFKECLLRACKVATHETGHMFSIKHCIQHMCNMNGSNSLEEMDNSPPYLCPEDLYKLCWNIGLDPIQRYKKLAIFWKKHGFSELVDFCEQSAVALEEHREKMDLVQ